jgi:hypothetical protein
VGGLLEFGSRAEPSEGRVKLSGGEKARKDWLEADVADAGVDAGGTRKDWLESRKEWLPPLLAALVLLAVREEGRGGSILDVWICQFAEVW